MGVLTPRTDPTPIQWVEQAHAAHLETTHVHVSLSPSQPNLLRYTLTTVEAALMPYLFPHGRGQYRRNEQRQWYAAYYKMRMSALFSIFTLCPLYLVLSTIQRYCYELSQQTTEAALEGAIRKYQREHPTATKAEVCQNVLKHTVPASAWGTPAFWRTNLLDLIALVQIWGMPHLFLTLTADELSELMWSEVTDMTELLKRFNNSYTFKNAPVECSKLFVQRVTDFMNHYILCKPVRPGASAVPGTNGGLLGRVQHHVIRYEVQARGSLHAHIMLWVHPDDIEGVANEIRADIPAKYDATTQDFVPPAADADNILFRYVTRKQMHECRPEGCCTNGPCKYHFPQPVHTNPNTTYAPDKRQYTYFRPRVVDRNVVPYHPTLLLMWGSHMNLQRVTNAAWTAYLLKYALKCEPTGNLNLDLSTLEKLGITGLSDVQLQVASALLMSRPVSPCEAALYMLGISPVQFSASVTKIDSRMPSKRFLPVRNSSIGIIVHPVDKYCARPRALTHVTFCTYFTDYMISDKLITTPGHTLEGKNSLGNHVYHMSTPSIVRFTDYHPAYNVEGYCYNLLLSKLPFRNETELLSQGDGSSYLHECIVRGIITCQDDLEGHIDDYTTKHLYSGDKLHLLVAELRQRLPSCVLTLLGMQTDDCDPAVPESPSDTPLPTFSTQQWYQDMSKQAPKLTPCQKKTARAICSSNAGLFTIQGGPGCGKTFLTRYIAHKHLKAGRSVIMTATTGAAAVRLSHGATTVHTAFGIPAKNAYLPHLDSSNPRYHALSAADVIIVDEFSMLTAAVLNIIMLRLQTILRCDTIEEVLQAKKIILIGDPQQLPPVCRLRNHYHARTGAHGVCPLCRVNAAACWQHAQHFTLTSNVRHAQDSLLATFLKHIHTNCSAINCNITQGLLDKVFKKHYVTQAAAAASLTPQHTVLCSHHEDVDFYNRHAMASFFAPAARHTVALHTNGTTVPDIADWLHPSSAPSDSPLGISHDSFHRLTEVAEGARVMLTSNFDLTQGAANGSMGTVLNWTKDKKDNINMIKIKLDNTQVEVKVRRTDFENLYHKGHRYYKSTFPLTLAYAITGHAAQGITLSTPTIVHIRTAFVPGLAYVMLSRTTTRHLLTIVNRLTPDMFQAMPPL
eukprot:GHRQ01001880.1.p1 GENE.GHRQ01001880.1~~GHRQ01001880.1.p1  ORF type:complete len:1314 (+),score=134.67 GHRQ01001880.1:549-3944(+)